MQASPEDYAIARTQVVLLEDSVRYYTAILQGGQSPFAYNARASASRNLGDFGQALEDFSAAIEISPRDAAYRLNRSTLWREYKRDLDRALADCDAALRINSRDARAHVLRGITRVQQREPDDALQSFNEAIRLRPHFGWAYARRAYAWSAKGDRDQMLNDLDEAIRLSPDDEHAWSARAWLLATSPIAEHRDAKQALVAATKACELTNWLDFHSLAILAAAHAEAGDFNQAVQWQEKVVSMLPAHQRSHHESRLHLYREKKPYRDVP
jgi:tetratricopeptide (TPR) repeat protein